MSFLSRLFHGAAHCARDQIVLTPSQVELRKEKVKQLELIKTVALISCIAGFLFSIAIPSFFQFALLAVEIFFTTEIFKFSNNILEIFNDTTVEFTARRSPENFYKQIGKNTYLAGSIARLSDPSLKNFVLAE